MDDCTRLEALLAEYAAGELRLGDHHWFKDHLACCSECAQVVAGYVEIISLAQQLPPLELPPELKIRLQSKALTS